MIILSEKTKPCLISCSVLKEELQKLVRQEDLDVDLIFVSKYFHTDYTLLEKNLRQVVGRNLPRFPGRIVLVYGDLCLGQDDEMKKLAKEFLEKFD